MLDGDVAMKRCASDYLPPAALVVLVTLGVGEPRNPLYDRARWLSATGLEIVRLVARPQS